MPSNRRYRLLAPVYDRSSLITGNTMLSGSLMELGARPFQFAIVSVVALLSQGHVYSAVAHPGGLDGAGCHHVRRTGEYHCHSGGGSWGLPSGGSGGFPTHSDPRPQDNERQFGPPGPNPHAGSQTKENPFVDRVPPPGGPQQSQGMPIWECRDIVRNNPEWPKHPEMVEFMKRCNVYPPRPRPY